MERVLLILLTASVEAQGMLDVQPLVQALSGLVDVQVRLAGPSSCSGRVEVNLNGTWGTVCDTSWDMNDAKVICREVGCDPAVGAPTQALFGEGTGPVWLNNVDCSGNESSLADCPSGGFGDQSCAHSQDAGAVCEAVQFRLSGPTSCSGRVEVYYGGTWGTVCDNSWDMNDAKVICREVGCDPAVGAPTQALFGEGTGSVWLNNVDCSGNESSLADCPSSGFGDQSCAHSQDAGAVCEAFQIRLSGPTSCSGRVEVYYGGTWGAVCDTSWDIKDAKVVCQELGCDPALGAPTQSLFGEGTGPMWTNNVGCSGSENSLFVCPSSGFAYQSCAHSQEAGAVCEPFQIRLSGPTNCSGRVEVYYAGTWGAVCDASWDLNDAKVVCQEVGCKPAFGAPTQSLFGEGTGLMWMNNVGCSGSENSLLDCSSSGLGNQSCAHSQEAGAVCEPFQIRLAGPTNCSGRVEVYYGGTWGTVCTNNWDLKDVKAVCREVGCVPAFDAPVPGFFGEGTGPVWLDNLNCSGSENSISDCPHSGYRYQDCLHAQDAGAICEALKVRLSGPTNCSGRVEVYYGGVWGTVCDEGFDMNDAAVVCRELGCEAAYGVRPQAYFGEGSGSIWLSNVGCSGSEKNLSDCSHGGFGATQCAHSNDVGVYCEATFEKWIKMQVVQNSTVDLNSPAVVENLLKQLKQNLIHHGADDDIKVKWMTPSDGNIFRRMGPT